MRVTMRTRISVALMAAFALAGMGTRASAQETPATLAARTPPSYLFAGPCVWRDLAGDDDKVLGDDTEGNKSATNAVVEAILGSAIDQTLDGIGSALSDAAAARTFSTTASINLDGAYRNDARCLQLWSGSLGGTVAVEGLDPRRLDAAGIEPASQPAMFLEIWVRPSSDGVYATLTPTIMIRNANLENGRSTLTDRPITLTASFEFAESGQEVSIEIPTRLFGRGLQVLLAESQVYPGECLTGSSGTVGRGCLIRGGIESRWFANPFVGDAPMTVTLSVAETRPQNPALTFVSTLFGDSRDELQAAANQQLLPSQRLEAERLALMGRAEARGRARSSYQAAEVARSAYCRATVQMRRVRSSELASRQALANFDARQAGDSEPYPSIVAVNGDVPGTAQCENLQRAEAADEE